MYIKSHFLKAAFAAAAVSVLAMSMAMAQEKTPLKIFATAFPDTDLETNKFSLKLEDKFNLDIAFDVTNLDGGPAKEKRQITLAGGDLPDAFFLISWVDGFSRAEQIKLGQEGVLIPLEDLIKKYAPDVEKALNELPDYRSMVTAPDGHIYAIQQWSDCYHCSYGSKLWMNTDWLKKLGLEIPKTTEEMKAALTAIKNGDPNGNGQADEIPLTGNVTDSVVPYFMNAFTYDPRFSQQFNSTLVLKDGKVVQQASTDGWREGLKYMHSLYADGLIDPAAFTQNRDGMVTTGNFADATLVGSATVLHPWAFVNVGQKDGRDKGYNAIPPLTGPSGANNATYVFTSAPIGIFAITNQAGEAQQKAALEVLNYMYQEEGHLLGQFGEEGVTWRKPKAGDIPLDKNLTPLYAQIRLPEGADPVNNAWRSSIQYYDTPTWRNSEVVPMEIYTPEGYERRLFEATDLYKGHAPMDQVLPSWNLWYDPADAADLAEAQTNIENYVSTSNVEFITGQRDINDDAAWADYVKGFDDLNGARLIEITQKAYDALKK